MKTEIQTALTLIIAACVTSPALAQGAGMGEEIYMQQCATCHGVDHKGTGPMAPALLVPPANLTTLAARNDGVFPTLRVVMRIDGRDPLVSHGSSMPVYGDFFEGNDAPLKAETGQPIMTSRPIVDLVEYLDGVQE